MVCDTLSESHGGETHRLPEGDQRDRIGILGLGSYLPERVMTNADWERLVDTSDRWITRRTGIERRRFAADDQHTSDLAVLAARAALEDAGIEVEQIDEIIVATDTPEVYSPDTAAFVQHLLGAREIPAYDLAGSGCAGFLQAIDVARSRVHVAGPGRPAKREVAPEARKRNILVVGVELLSKLMDWSDRATCVLFGDGAGAVVVGAGAGAAEIVAVVTGTDGSKTDILGLEIGGTRQPFTHEDTPLSGMKITMDGQKVFREAVRRMIAACREVLERTGLTLDDVDLVVPHQANLRILSAVAKALDLPDEKLFVNVQDVGNTGSASVPIALAQAYSQGLVQGGSLVLLTSFGAGFHWGAALIRF